MAILYADIPPSNYLNQFKDQVKQLPHQARSYFKSMFPIVDWLPHYNWIWLSGDLTAAVTVGTLVIPQSLAYAKIANLPPVYGLYTSFIGVISYPLFGTSKDISIGKSAIMSLLVGQIITKFVTTSQYLSGEWTMTDAVTTLALFAGFITMLIGLLRLGPLFYFICQPAIAGFMAGSGLTIVINQFSKIFGVPGINTSEAPYLVFGKTLINLNHSTVDAAFGLTSLLYLYVVKYLAQHLMRRYPRHGRLIFFFNTSRSIVVLVFSTLICFMINHFGHFEKSPFQIIGNIPAGFGHIGTPTIKPSLVGFFGSDLIGIVVLLVMEHGAIASSLGKITDYKVDMSQEVFTIGIANIFGSFFGAYPGTGAFSRTAVMSKSGTRTPLTGFFVGIIVVLSIYVFTPAFTYIPNASLAAIIAHAVSDLISGPTTWKRFWDVHPTELLIFACAYIISLFTRIDISVYVPVVLSLVVQIYRTTRPQYAFLGSLNDDIPVEKQDEEASIEKPLLYPMDHPVLKPYLHPVDPSVICFQPQENIVFQNASFTFEKLIDMVKKTTRQGKPLAEKIGDRPWNNVASPGKEQEKPLLKAIVLDLSGVHQMDFTGMETLMDTSIAIERYVGSRVSWYIVPGLSPHVRKCLLFAGFGTQRRDAVTPGKFLSDLSFKNWHPDGTKGCCMKAHLEEKGKGREEVVEIEQVNEKLKKKDRIIGLKIMSKYQEDASCTDIVLPSKINEYGKPWCDCSLSAADLDKVSVVQDRFPYFFGSLHDAVKASVRQRTEQEQDVDKISVISDKGLGSSSSSSD
ncbi:hypothetical protein RMCBS344292_16170 [Rhizopus microsporus]|nr:hypothetical protein RMCBS344292_16170 [Rhizopus microsporus]